MQRYFSIFMGVVLGAMVLGGCSSSTDPSGGPVELVFSPERLFMDVVVPEAQDFQVSTSRPATFQATWVLNGEQVGTEKIYHYQSGRVGIDTLTVQTVLEGTSSEREWLVTVLPSPSLAPPAVPEVLINHGEEPMDVVLSWHWISQSTFPITDYLVVSSYDGPVTVDNWDEAVFQGAFPHVPGQAGYSAVFTAEEHGMLPATTIWFGIRGQDDRGQLSPIPEIYRHTISFAWWIEGTVYDTDQNVLPEIIIDYGCGSCRVNTDVNGFYRIGPFRDIDEVDIYTLSRDEDYPDQPFTSWYDFRAEPIVYSEVDNTHDFTLITRYGGTAEPDFLTLFRQMTWTDEPSDLRPNHRLYKWEEYPVQVFIPDHVRQSDGLDFGQNCRLGMSYWNLVMGEDYLVETTDPNQAQIEFYFEDLGSGANGITSLAAPQIPYYYSLGDVIPEKVNLGINNDVLPNEQRVQETAMHELGHALGLYGHVPGASGDDYLMAITSSGALDDGPENAVHIDEKRLLHVIRYLPQGLDISGYILE